MKTYKEFTENVDEAFTMTLKSHEKCYDEIMKIVNKYLKTLESITVMEILQQIASEIKL